MSVAIRPICLTFLLGVVACAAPSPEDICNRFGADCGWDIDTCVEDLTALQISGDKAGCEEEADEYLRCRYDQDESLCYPTGSVFCPEAYNALSACIANPQTDP